MLGVDHSLPVSTPTFIIEPKFRDYTMGSIIMPKISKEEIIKAVERYKRGETSQKAEAKKQGVSLQTFQDWITRR